MGNNFKIGDSVKISDFPAIYGQTSHGVVIDVDANDEKQPYRVEFTDGHKMWLAENELQLTE